MTTLAALFLVAAAVALQLGPGRARARLRAVAAPGAPSRRPMLRPSPRVRPGWAAALAGVAVWAVVGGVPGVVAGLLAGTVLHRALARLEPRDRRIEREAAAAALPFAADLLAAALRAGSTPEAGLRCVGTAVGGGLGRRLHRVAAAAALGAEPAEVWRPLVDVPGALPVVRAALRSGQSGAALADALQRAADSARASTDAAGDAAARRAGVLVVLPVGLCFLPAFVLLGVVPVAIGVLAEVLGA